MRDRPASSSLRCKPTIWLAAVLRPVPRPPSSPAPASIEVLPPGIGVPAPTVGTLVVPNGTRDCEDAALSRGPRDASGNAPPPAAATPLACGASPTTSAASPWREEGTRARSRPARGGPSRWLLARVSGSEAVLEEREEVALGSRGMRCEPASGGRACGKRVMQ
jgi:hypothetical protein